MMKKLVLLMVTLTAMVFAGGGTIAPQSIAAPVYDKAGNFYVGGAFLRREATQFGGEFCDVGDVMNRAKTDRNGNGFVALVGYDLLSFLALEGRYAKTDNSETFGAFLKPQLNVGNIGVYGLVGYEKTKEELETIDVKKIGWQKDTWDGLTYGGGVQMKVTKHIGAFVEYNTNKNDSVVDKAAYLGGLTYRF